MTNDEAMTFAAIVMVGAFVVFYLFFRGDK